MKTKDYELLLTKSFDENDLVINKNIYNYILKNNFNLSFIKELKIYKLYFKNLTQEYIQNQSNKKELIQYLVKIFKFLSNKDDDPDTLDDDKHYFYTYKYYFAKNKNIEKEYVLFLLDCIEFLQKNDDIYNSLINAFYKKSPSTYNHNFLFSPLLAPKSKLIFSIEEKERINNLNIFYKEKYFLYLNHIKLQNNSKYSVYNKFFNFLYKNYSNIDLNPLINICKNKDFNIDLLNNKYLTLIFLKQFVQEIISLDKKINDKKIIYIKNIINVKQINNDFDSFLNIKIGSIAASIFFTLNNNFLNYFILKPFHNKEFLNTFINLSLKFYLTKKNNEYRNNYLSNYYIKLKPQLTELFLDILLKQIESFNIKEKEKLMTILPNFYLDDFFKEKDTVFKIQKTLDNYLVKNVNLLSHKNLNGNPFNHYNYDLYNHLMKKSFHFYNTNFLEKTYNKNKIFIDKDSVEKVFNNEITSIEKKKYKV